MSHTNNTVIGSDLQAGKIYVDLWTPASENATTQSSNTARLLNYLITDKCNAN